MSDMTLCGGHEHLLPGALTSWSVRNNYTVAQSCLQQIYQLRFTTRLCKPPRRTLHTLCFASQDPVIFSGTVRHNLDPVDRVASDADLWAAVRSAGLNDALQSLEVCSLLAESSLDIPLVQIRLGIAVTRAAMDT